MLKLLILMSVTVCYSRTGGPGGLFQTRHCVDASCANSGSDISAGAAYAETTQSISVNYVKGGSSDIEIGLLDTNAAKKVKISQISAVFTYTPPVDTTAPSAVSDLALSGATVNSIDLDWTAPGDDAGSGTATTYDVRYSTSVINEGNWGSATQATGEPSPSIAGTAESMTVSGLLEDTTYYFAIKTSDEVPNT